MERGERVSYYLFDEGLSTFLLRSKALGMDLMPYIDNGLLTIHHIDPAEVAPGEFSHMLRTAIERNNAKFVVIDPTFTPRPICAGLVPPRPFCGAPAPVISWLSRSWKTTLLDL